MTLSPDSYAETWQDFRNGFSKRQEDAIWQYLIDHSMIQANGYIGFRFYVADIHDFYRRVHARYTGQFSRYNRMEVEHQAQLVKLKYRRQTSDRIHIRMREIDKSGTFMQKLIVWAYKKSQRYLLK